jgi:hypothetical protein
MNKILEIRKVIAELIRDAGVIELYYQKPAEIANFPYIVLDIANSIDDGTLERFVLDIDGYGNAPSTVSLETIMDTADKALHRKTVYVTSGASQLGITFYRENRLTFDETDKRLHRRRYIYQIRTHEN